MGRVAVTLKISDAEELTPHQAKVLAKWLKEQARKLIKDRGEYGPHYTATIYGW